jgi:hypothetical protein
VSHPFVCALYIIAMTVIGIYAGIEIASLVVG